MVNGYGLGANSYVRKPVDFEQFVEACANWALLVGLNERPPARIGGIDEWARENPDRR